MKLGAKLLSVLCLVLITVFCVQVVVPWNVSTLVSAQAATKVKLNKTKATIYNGKTLQLKMKGTKEKVTWSSSAKKIATVDKKGKVTAKKVGKATITATVGKKKYTCKITVKSPLTISPKKLSISEGEEARVAISYYLDGDIVYSESKSGIVDCTWEDGWDGDDTGLIIKGVAAGKTTITIKNSKTKDVVKVKVTVTPAPVVEYVYEIGQLFGKDIATANSMLKDKLIYYKENFYSNGPFGVTVDSSGCINAMILTDGDGLYTLMYIYPGMSMSAAHSQLVSLGFKIAKNSSTVTYLNSALPGMYLSVKYANGVVDHVGFGV